MISLIPLLMGHHDACYLSVSTGLKAPLLQVLSTFQKGTITLEKGTQIKYLGFNQMRFHLQMHRIRFYCWSCVPFKGFWIWSRPSHHRWPSVYNVTVCICVILPLNGHLSVCNKVCLWISESGFSTLTESRLNHNLRYAKMQRSSCIFHSVS